MFQPPFSIILAIASSVAICALVLLTSKWHGKWSFDPLKGTQKFHRELTPRIGGLAVIGSCIVAFMANEDLELISILRLILVCALIPFFFGFREDLTKDGSVSQRLSASVAAAGAGIWLTGIYLNRVDVVWLDQLLGIPSIAIIFTLNSIYFCSMSEY
jgi:UDP-N-acetylmuramyl pentapeptide phosphotransferase/UDP-N-acetylglucosamine-1-phosphate transferase